MQRRGKWQEHRARSFAGMMAMRFISQSSSPHRSLGRTDAALIEISLSALLGPRAEMTRLRIPKKAAELTSLLCSVLTF
jgi:hypothetical protein